MFKVIKKGCEPEVKTELSVGIDLKSAVDVTLYVGATIRIPLGVVLDLNTLKKEWYIATDQNPDRPSWKQFLKSHFVQLAPRSSIRANGIISGQGYIELDFVPLCLLDLELNNTSCKSFSNEKNVNICCENCSNFRQNELMLIAHNFSNNQIEIEQGQRIAQAVLLEHKSYLSGYKSTTKRTGGIGSSDEKS